MDRIRSYESEHNDEIQYGTDHTNRQNTQQDRQEYKKEAASAASTDELETLDIDISEQKD